MICRSLDGLQICDGKITKTPSAPTPVSQIEVTVEVLCERHSSTAQSIVSIDGQLGYKPQRSSFDGDLERALENPVPR